MLLEDVTYRAIRDYRGVQRTEPIDQFTFGSEGTITNHVVVTTLVGFGFLPLRSPEVFLGIGSPLEIGFMQALRMRQEDDLALELIFDSSGELGVKLLHQLGVVAGPAVISHDWAEVDMHFVATVIELLDAVDARGDAGSPFLDNRHQTLWCQGYTDASHAAIGNSRQGANSCYLGGKARLRVGGQELLDIPASVVDVDRQETVRGLANVVGPELGVALVRLLGAKPQVMTFDGIPDLFAVGVDFNRVAKFAMPSDITIRAGKRAAGGKTGSNEVRAATVGLDDGGGTVTEGSL